MDGLSLATARDAVEAVRAATHLDLGTVLCGKRSAYVERSDDAFLDQAAPYYAKLEVVDDLLAVDDDVLKVAVYDFGSAATGAGPLLQQFDALVSGEHWVDVMSPTADKGHALRAVQDTLGITADQTMAFGDYFNDVGMLDAASFSFAMDNAHPDVRAHARFVAPSNNANGVVRTIRSVLGLVMSVAGLLLTPGFGGTRDGAPLVAVEKAVAPLPVLRLDLPKTAAPAVAEVRAQAEAFASSLGVGTGDLVLGGRSFGGRMCSMAVAQGLPAAGLVLLSYPLHPPGRPGHAPGSRTCRTSTSRSSPSRARPTRSAPPTS